MYYKATTKIPQQRIIANKPTKKIRWNHKEYSINPKVTSTHPPPPKKKEKEERSNKERIGQIENK